MHGWGLLQLLVIINFLVLFIEYAYQTLVVYPVLYRYHLILLLYFVILLLHCIVCIKRTTKLNGNKHICICIHNRTLPCLDTCNLIKKGGLTMEKCQKFCLFFVYLHLLWNIVILVTNMTLHEIFKMHIIRILLYQYRTSYINIVLEIFVVK